MIRGSALKFYFRRNILIRHHIPVHKRSHKNRIPFVYMFGTPLGCTGHQLVDLWNAQPRGIPEWGKCLHLHMWGCWMSCKWEWWGVSCNATYNSITEIKTVTNITSFGSAMVNWSRRLTYPGGDNSFVVLVHALGHCMVWGVSRRAPREPGCR